MKELRRILVSGGFGYIGSYLVKYLLGRGHHVGVVVRSVPDYFTELAEQVDVYIEDVRTPIDRVLDESYDVFVHLAAANDVDSTDPDIAIATTVLGTRNCLEFCRQNGIERFIYYSTFQVYGADSGQIDEDTPLEPRNEYAITHALAEEYVRMYERVFGMSYLILRPVNLYGPPAHRDVDRWTLVPNCFCRSAYEEGKIVLRTSGKQTKDFVSLEYLCGVTTLLCQGFDERKNRTFNVASGSPMTIVDVARITMQVYERLFGGTCELVIESGEPARAKEMVVSTDMLRDIGFDYSTEHSLERDIEDTFHLLAKE